MFHLLSDHNPRPKLSKMEQALEQALRKGVIPLCCSGATSCFALYSAKVTLAAKQWAVLDTGENDTVYEGSQFSRHANLLNQHAGTCAALSLISAVATYEAVKDWRGYRKLPSLDHIENWLLKRPLPFFARTTVLCTAAFSLICVKNVNGGLQFLQPSQPVIVSQNRRKDP